MDMGVAAIFHLFLSETKMTLFCVYVQLKNEWRSVPDWGSLLRFHLFYACPESLILFSDIQLKSKLDGTLTKMKPAFYEFGPLIKSILKNNSLTMYF